MTTPSLDTCGCTITTPSPPLDTTGVNAVLLVVVNPPGADGDTISPLGVVRSSFEISCLVVVLASILSVPTMIKINRHNEFFLSVYLNFD